MRDSGGNTVAIASSNIVNFETGIIFLQDKVPLMVVAFFEFGSKLTFFIRLGGILGVRVHVYIICIEICSKMFKQTSTTRKL